MTEQERIQALLEDGKISQEEADLLLEAIGEADAAEAEAAEAEVAEAETRASVASGAETGGATTSELAFPPEPGHPEAPPAPSPPTAPSPPPQANTSQGSSAAHAKRPSGLRWLTIRLMAKNLEIRSDSTLSEPQVEGARLEQDGEGWQIEAQNIESLLNPGSIAIRLPPETGVDLSTKAGNVEVEGVPFFRGRVAAGNVELTQVRGVDLELKAGNLDAELLLTEGEHRVQLSMGNADVELLAGSSVSVSGRASLGRLDMAGPSRVGEGSAKLDLHVKMGNLDVKVPRE